MRIEDAAACQVKLDLFCRTLTKHFTEDFATDERYSAAAAATTPSELARKMTLALDNGTGSKDGDGVKKTCKELGIPHTFKAIRQWLNTP